jgi:hypothetical protein
LIQVMLHSSIIFSLVLIKHSLSRCPFWHESFNLLCRSWC